MTAKQFWACTALTTVGSLIVIGIIVLMRPHAPMPADPTAALRRTTCLPATPDPEYRVPHRGPGVKACHPAILPL